MIDRLLLYFIFILIITPDVHGQEKPSDLKIFIQAELHKTISANKI